MNIVSTSPQNIDEINRAFRPSKSAVFTYGNTLHNPGNGFIDEYLLKHEETHASQQGMEPDAWWEQYIADKDFRLHQETEAYHNQYVFYAKVHKDRNMQARFLHGLAQDFSSAMYGNIISYQDAVLAIKYG